MENKSIFGIISKDDIVVGSMLYELIREVESQGFNPAAPILRVVDFSPISGETDMDVVGSILEMNRSKINEDVSGYSEYEKFQVQTTEWHAEMSIVGDWYGTNDGYAEFDGQLQDWWVFEPDGETSKVSGFAKFGVPYNQPSRGRIGVVVRYHYIYKYYESWCYGCDYIFEAFKYSDMPNKAFKLRSEEPVTLNLPQWDDDDNLGMYVEDSPDVKEDDVKEKLLAALSSALDNLRL